MRKEETRDTHPCGPRILLPDLCFGFLPGSESGKTVADRCAGFSGEVGLHRCSKFLIAEPAESCVLGEF